MHFVLFWVYAIKATSQIRDSEMDIKMNQREPVEVPTYDEYLESVAQELYQHPVYALAKGAFRIAQFFVARERAWVSLLTDKGVLGEGDDLEIAAKTEELTQSLDKDLIKRAIRATAGGEIKIPVNGKEVILDPDTAAGLVREFLLNDMPSAEGMKMFTTFMSSENKIREHYEDYVAKAKAHNEQLVSERDQRARAVSIYVSKCRLAGREVPELEQQLMIDGSMPIPEL